MYDENERGYICRDCNQPCTRREAELGRCDACQARLRRGDAQQLRLIGENARQLPLEPYPGTCPWCNRTGVCVGEPDCRYISPYATGERR